MSSCKGVRIWGPIQKISVDTCARSCTDNNKFNYVPGKTYEYQYDADVKTAVKGASEDKAGIHMSAIVKMEVISKCDLVMRLSDVTLTEYDPIDLVMKEVSSEFRDGLQKTPVRISFQDGNIEDICLQRKEPTWVLNAKRGILSMFQNNMDDFSTNQTVSETDVSGVCDTDYFVSKSGWYTTTVGKSKNLLGCTARTGYNTAVQGVPYTADSDIQSLPIIRSNHDCVHEIDSQSRYLKSSTCHEQHLFLPFSRSDSGAVTHNTQTLKFIKMTSETNKPVTTSTRVSLKFDHVNDPDKEVKSRKDVTRKLIEICEKTKAGVRPETPRLFTDLVYMLKTVDAETITDVYKLLQDGAICTDNKERTRKFFLDALPMAGSSASLHLMTQLLVSNVVTGVEADMWLSTLAFIKNPTKDMLKEIKPLINMKDNTDKALLSVGTLIHSYCYHHGNCEGDDMVRAIISAMENKIAKGCKVNQENLKTTLMALRGIGNAGYAQSAIPILEVCVKINTNPIEIRLSAIDAFRRMPCDSSRKELIKTFRETDEDSEIRIAAYKVLMECPTAQLLSLVKTTLEKEEVNQVGSYIWSHLTNLMETSDRHKQDIRAILEDETFKKEFDLDKRKFSRNYEGSMFIEKLNTGAKLEGDLIWSSKSFVPRSAMLNLTVDLFGHSVNLLELGGRAEGIEYFLESFFGPNGYFSGQGFKDGHDIMAKGLRQDKIKRIDGRMSSKMDELRGSMYMRVFGNELRYMNFQGMDDLLSSPSFNILDMLMQLAKDNDHTFSHSTMFLDTSIIIPTGSGFPMNLTVNGTATIDLRVKGKMDLKSPPTVVIDGLVQPSAAIDISSMMSVDAFVTKSGIKMVSTLHSSTAVQGKFQVNEAGVISAEYEMPQPKMEIIDIKSSFFTVHRTMEKEQSMITENRSTKEVCSPAKLVTITGLELCAEVAYPNASLKSDAPYFPLTGPINAGIYLYNRDTHRKYQMEARFQNNKESNILHFTFDTPESRIDRKVVLDLNLNKKDKTVGMTLTSPWKKANLQGAVTLKKDVSGINGQMSVDGKSGYLFNAKFVKARKGKSYKYMPALEISSPGNEPLSIRGMLMYNDLQQLDLEYDMSGVTADPVSSKLTVYNKPALKGIKASLALNKGSTYSFDSRIMIQEDKKKVQYKPIVSIRSPTEEVLAFGGTVKLIYNKKIDVNLVLDKIVDKITFIGAVSQTVKNRGRVLYNTKMSFTADPVTLNLKSRIDNKNFRSIATDVDFTYVIRRVARDNIKIVSKLINLSSSSLTKAKAVINFASKRKPELNLKMTSNINHNKKHTEVDVDLRYGENFKDKDKYIDMSFEMNHAFRSLTSASADITTRLSFPAQDLNMMLKGKHMHSSKQLDSSISLRLGKGQQVESSLRIMDKTESLIKVTSEYGLSYPGRDIFFNHTLSQTDENTYVSTLNTQVHKGQKNAIITTLKTYEGKERVTFSSDLLLNKQTPAHFQGEFDFNPMDFISSLSYEKDSKKYAGSLTSVTEGTKTSKLTIDFQHPDRHVILNLDGKNMNERFQGEAALMWNVGRNDSEKVHILTWLEPHMPEKLNGSISVTYPARTLTLNAHHLSSPTKYSTHADFQWETDMKISADTVLLSNKNTITAKMTTPFEALPTLSVVLAHKDNDEEYLTNVKVDWDASESVSAEFNLKKPMSLKTLVASFSTKTSLKALRRMKLEVNHKLSDSLASSAKCSWNKQFVQASVILQNTTKGMKMGFKGAIDMKTSFSYMKTGILKLSHDNNGQRFNTVTSFKRNKKLYEISSKVTHSPSADTYENTGLVNIRAPTGNSETTWNHRYTAQNIMSTLTTTWGKKDENVITVKLNGKFDKLFATTLELQTPFDSARDALLQVNWRYDNDLLDSKVHIILNGEKVCAAAVGFKSYQQVNDAFVTLYIPALNINSRIEGNATSQVRVASAYFNAVLTPSITMSLKASRGLDRMEKYGQSLILWKASFPGYENMNYEFTDIVEEQSRTTTNRLEYGDNKVIEMKAVYDENSGYASLTTPYESLPRMQAKIRVIGNMDSFDSDAFIEILPVLEKISASMSMSTVSGLKTKIRVDTPFTEYSSFHASLNAKTDNERSNSFLLVEYLPGKTVQVDITTDMGEIIIMTAKMTSPFVTVDLSHSGNLQSFISRAEMEKEPGKTYGLTIGYTNGTKMEAYATVSVPGKRDINAVISHQGSALNFVSHAEVTHNRKNQFISDLSFAADRVISVSASTSLKSELISNDEYEAVFRSEVTPLVKISTHGEFATTSLGKSEADLTFDMTSDIEGSLTIKSPMIKNIEASFNHAQSKNYIQSRAEFTQGGDKKVDMLASLNMDSSVVGEINIKSPLSEEIQILSRFNGEIENFALHVEGSVGVNKTEMDFTHRWNNKYSQQAISLKATGMKDIMAELSFTGDYDQMRSYAELNMGQDRHRVDATYTGLPSNTEGELSVTSPLVDPMSASFFVKGSVQKFNTHGELIIGSDKSELDITFGSSPHLEGSVSVNSPYWTDVSAKFDHTGELPNIISHAQVILDSKDTFDAKLTLSTKEGLSGSFALQMPFTNYSSIEMSVSHEGAVNNFRSHGEYSLNYKKSELDLYYSSLSRYEGMLTITSHLTDNIAIGFEHKGTKTNFKSHGEYSIGLEKTELDISADIDADVDMNLRLRSPRTEDITARITHAGGFSNFATKTDLTIGNKKSEGGIKFQFSDKTITSSINIKSPYMDNFNMNFNHNGEPKNFATKASVTIGDETSEGDVTFQASDNAVTSAISIKSPYTEDINVNFNHKGKATDFATKADVTVGSEKSEGNVSFQWTDNMMKSSISINSPNMEVVTINIHEERGTKKYVYHGDYSVGELKSEADVKLDFEDKKATIAVSSPKVLFNFEHSGDIRDFTCTMDLISDMDRYTSEAKFRVDDKVEAIEASVKLTSPVEGMESVSAIFSHNGKPTNFKCHGELNLPGKNSIGDIKINVDQITNMEGSLELSSPIIPDIVTKFSHSRMTNEYRSMSEVSIDGEVIYGITASFTNASSLQGSFELKTPITDYSVIRLSGTHEADKDHFRSFAELLIGSDSNEMELTFSNKTKLEGSFALRTMYLPHLKANFDVTGTSSSFRGVFDGEKKGSIDVSLNLEGKIDASITMELPLENYTRINGNLLIDSNSELLEMKTALTNEGRKIIDAGVKIVYQGQLSGQLSLKSTYLHPLAANFDFAGDRQNFRTTAEITHNNEQLAIGNVNFNFDPSPLRTSGSASFNKLSVSYKLDMAQNDADSTNCQVSVKTPFEGFEDIGLTFYREGDISNFQAGGKVVYAVGKDIEAGVEHSLSGSKLQSRVHFMSPFTDEIVLSVNHAGVPTDFVSSYELAMGRDNRIKSETSLKTGFQFVTFVSTVTTTMSGETYVEKVELKHDGSIEKFKTEVSILAMEKLVRLDTSFQLEPVIEGSASIISPFENVEECKIMFTHSGSTTGFLSTGKVQYAPKKEISSKIDFLNHGWRRTVATVEVRTPFEGMKMNKITYQHAGDSDSFQFDTDLSIASQTVTSALKVSRSPLNMDLNINTPFEGYKSLRFTGNLLTDSKERHSTRIVASWNPTDSIVFDGSFSALKGQIEGSASLTTPFAKLQRSSIEFGHQELSYKFMEHLKVTFNGSRIVDLEIDHSLMDERKHAIVTVRDPHSMKFEMSGDFTLENVEADASANWNTENSDSNLRLEAGYDVRTNKRMNFKLTRPGQIISYHGTLDHRHSKSDLVWGIGSTEKAGYEITINDYDSKLKLILPTRSLELSGSHRSKVTEGSFLWDAAVDRTKMVGFRSVIVPSNDAIKADVTVQLPSLGKHVQLGSEVVVNRGRVIFDSKTAFSYSSDESKKIVFSSRLEDVSLGESKNFSFSMGLSHPYSTVGLKLSSHVGSSKDRYSAGMGLEYLTTQRQTKTFQVNGQINKLRKTISFELQSPVKSISISGSAQTDDKFRVSVLNIYDQKQPLTTVFTVDPATRSIDFFTNYDLQNPRSEFHINAKYVNSSALAAEVFHIVNQERVSDILVTARLNNSHLLHTRVHWRPDMIRDLEALREKKSDDYNRRINAAATKIEAAVVEEIVQKFNLIWDAVGQEIGQENVAAFEAAVIPALNLGLETFVGTYGLVYDNYVQYAINMANTTRHNYNNFVQQYQEFSKTAQLPTNMNDMDYTFSVRKPVEQSINYALELIKVPAKSLPSQVTGALKCMIPVSELRIQLLEDANKYWELEDHLESIIEAVIVMFEEEAEQGLLDLKRIILSSVRSPITVYDPAHGDIQAEFFIPIPLKSLDMVPVIDLARYTNKVMKYVPSKVPGSQYVPDMKAEWLPPFTGMASIANGHKVTTFDGSIYDLDADCTFVLVRDYRDGNFSVILNNNGGTTLTVLSHGKPIEIKQEGEISVGQETVSLPYTDQNIVITSSDDGIITIDGANHFKVEYDLSVDHISVQINGWYYGRIAGLLGTYDNEPSNDLTTSYNKVNSNTNRFAKTWDVGNTGCRD